MTKKQQRRYPLPPDGIIDEVAIDRAIRGEYVRLTRDEREIAAIRLLAAGSNQNALVDRLGMSNNMARNLYRSYHQPLLQNGAAGE